MVEAGEVQTAEQEVLVQVWQASCCRAMEAVGAAEAQVAPSRQDVVGEVQVVLLGPHAEVQVPPLEVQELSLVGRVRSQHTLTTIITRRMKTHRQAVREAVRLLPRLDVASACHRQTGHQGREGRRLRVEQVPLFHQVQEVLWRFLSRRHHCHLTSLPRRLQLQASIDHWSALLSVGKASKQAGQPQSITGHCPDWNALLSALPFRIASCSAPSMTTE